MRSRDHAGVWLTTPLILLVVFLVAAPLAVFLVYSVLEPRPFGVELSFTLENYRRVASGALWWRLMGASLQVGLTTAAISVVLGYVLAYYMAFHAGRSRHILLGLTAVSILGGYLVRIYAWRTVLGTEGIINTALQLLGLIDAPLGWLIFNRGAVTVALVNVFVPFAAVMIYARLINLDSEHVQAARDLGGSPLVAFWRVTMPLSGRAVYLAFAFIFLLSAADYVTPQLVGGTHGTMIGVAIQDEFLRLGNWPLGAALGFTVFALVALCLGTVWGLFRIAGLLPRGAGE